MFLYHINNGFLLDWWSSCSWIEHCHVSSDRVVIFFSLSLSRWKWEESVWLSTFYEILSNWWFFFNIKTKLILIHKFYSDAFHYHCQSNEMWMLNKSKNEVKEDLKVLDEILKIFFWFMANIDCTVEVHRTKYQSNWAFNKKGNWFNMPDSSTATAANRNNNIVGLPKSDDQIVLHV